MDNFFDLLIGFIIVYSLLSPLFKKKKPKDEPSTHEEYPDSVSYESDDSDKSIADEISILFGEKPAKPKFEPDRTEAYHQENYSESHPKKKFERMVYSEESKNVSHQEKVKRVISADEQKRITDLADKFLSHQMSPNEESVPNEKRDKIISVFHSPENLRDYILFAEIFGKPKALRH